MKKTMLAAAILSAIGVPALAAPCRGPNGRFTKCPTTTSAATAATTRCKDAKGRFTRCTATTTTKTSRTSTAATAAH